jgi:hypothetical protein
LTALQANNASLARNAFFLCKFPRFRATHVVIHNKNRAIDRDWRFPGENLVKLSHQPVQPIRSFLKLET